jgi:hypothetical protein
MAVLASDVLAVGLGTVVVAVAIGAVLFVVVCVVAAVLMALLQAVLPRVDTEAEAVHRAEGEWEADVQVAAGDVAEGVADDEQPRAS